MLGDEAGEGRAAREAAAALPQRHVEVDPFLAGHAVDRARRAGSAIGRWRRGRRRPRRGPARPSAGPLAVGGGVERAANRAVREEPPGRPRRPSFRAASTAVQVSSGTPRTGPAWASGHRPVASRWARAQVRIFRSDSRRGRTGRCFASRWVSDEPPGRPRRPLVRAMLTIAQISSDLSATGPELVRGQRPVAARWASAQRGSVERQPGEVLGCGRRGARPAIGPATSRPAGRDCPEQGAADRLPGLAGGRATGPDPSTGHSPVASRWASAQARISRRQLGRVRYAPGPRARGSGGRPTRRWAGRDSPRPGPYRSCPRLALGMEYRAGVARRPSAGGLVVGVGPGQDLLGRHGAACRCWGPGGARPAAGPATCRPASRGGRPAARCRGSATSRRPRPGPARTTRGRPSAGGRVMGVGPGKIRSTVSGPRTRGAPPGAAPATSRRVTREGRGQGHVDPRPRLAGGGGLHRAGVGMRVLARGLAMGVGPRQDLIDIQRRQIVLVADAPMLLEQVGQRRPARQAAVAVSQGAVDLAPVQIRLVAHRAGAIRGHRPVASRSAWARTGSA